MSNTLNLIWIDDNPERAGDSINLENALNIPCKFIDIKNEQDAMKGILQGNEPDLILIDHNLEDTSSGDFRKGSTVAAYIRETWPDCPIVCITAEDIKAVDSNKRSQYEEILPINRISEYYSAIYSIATSFRNLKEKRPEKYEDILLYLRVPEMESERLKAIMPKELKEDFSNKSLLLDLCHWVRKVFLKRPGFVYDELWTSTIVGLKSQSFGKVEKMFEGAKYNGIFSDNSSPRWWKSEVLKTLSEHVPLRGLPWEKGRSLPNINKEDYSVCYASQEEFPETVAFVDDTENSKLAPMKLKQTMPHPNYEGLLFFEEIRMMKPAE